MDISERKIIMNTNPFKVGDKALCIDDNWNKRTLDLYRDQIVMMPKLGEIYTVRYVKGIDIRLVEIVNPKFVRDGRTVGEPVYWHMHFQKVVNTQKQIENVKQQEFALT